MKKSIFRSARTKRKHPCEKGTLEAVAFRKALSLLRNKRRWRKHYAPFSKTLRGLLRRQLRKFMENEDCDLY